MVNNKQLLNEVEECRVWYIENYQRRGCILALDNFENMQNIEFENRFIIHKHVKARKKQWWNDVNLPFSFGGEKRQIPAIFLPFSFFLSKKVFRKCLTSLYCPLLYICCHYLSVISICLRHFLLRTDSKPFCLRFLFSRAFCQHATALGPGDHSSR